MSSRETDGASGTAIYLRGPADEADRILEAGRYSSYGQEAAADLDRIVRLATAMIGVKIAFVSFVLGDRTVIKARFGSTLTELDPAQSICSHVVASARPLVVSDLSEDERFRRLDIVRGGLRFYAGVPLTTDMGFTIGAFGVLGKEPRPGGLTPEQREALHAFAALALRILSGSQAERRWQDYLDTASDWVWEQDADFRFSYFSSDGCASIPLSHRPQLGRTRWEAIGADIVNDPLWAAHKACLDNRQPFRDFRYSGTIAGKHITFSISGKPIYGPDNTFLGYRGVARDVTAEELARKRIEHLANHDHLTGLTNRANFEHGLNSAIEAASSSTRRSTVFLLDLDNFKDVNDSRGHSAGDEMLVKVAQRLKSAAGPKALVARLGGDEFAVLLPDTADDAAVARKAEAIIALIAEPYTIGDETITSSCSIGIAHIPDDGLTAGQVVGNADLALYEAKLAGRRRFRFFDAAMRRSVEAARETAAEFADAIERGQLEIYYQPQVRLADRATVAFEALLRWNHPQRGLLLPGAFKSALDDGPLAVAAGRWVIETAARQCRAWADMGHPVRVAVNLSQAQFRDDDLPTLVEGVLRKHAVPRNLLELEVTENILLDEAVEVSEPLKALAALGVSIAFDDFGTGYASLSHLRCFPINRIKIDRQFVRDIGRRADGATISQAIVSLGRSLGLGVTAEGIESREQEMFLRLSGCDEVQGFLYGRPMPVDAATARLLRPASEEVAC